MHSPDLFFDRARLFNNLCDTNYLRMGFLAVRKNKGSAGIDGVSTEDFENRLEEELGRLQKELEGWTYEPSPVRRVDIPKPGKAGEFRMLGIPTVRDRVVQTTLKNLLEPIFEPLFSTHSYGFRPGRNQRQAVEAAQKIVASGKPFVVDIDLSKFFDRVNHDRLMAQLTRQIEDKRVLRVIGKTLRSGIMHDGLIHATTEGTTQGSPLSPLLSNIVLDELDKHIERRGLEFCRFADDCNIFVGSKKAADRAMANVTSFIEGKLKLKVNREKSKVGTADTVKFLGMTIIAVTIAISAMSMERAMGKVKELTRRGTSATIEQSIASINQWYVGWANYHSMTNYPSQLHRIEGHIRRRLRARLISGHRTKCTLVNKLVREGAPERLARKQVYSNDGRWALSRKQAVERAFSNRWFEDKGLKSMSKQKLAHWFNLDRIIKLT
jgi:RNA-directed DNA polymerase